ncbi:MAG TPA: aspartate aminotransferase family protein [Armatimonadota bacterium]|nr:aspartate aminotransferase family protein [Armatimonadota bacterium]
MIPNIKTELPGPEARKYIEISKKYEPNSMSDQVPAVWSKGRGAVVEDVDGNVFIDFTSGVLVTNIGHCHPKHTAAIQEQAAELMNAYDFVNPWRAKLAQKLVEITSPNLDKAFILSTGGEATEAAIKVARRYAGKYEIIAFHGAFHGRTYMAMSVGGKQGVKRHFGPMVPGILHAPFCYCYRCIFEQTYPECDMTCLRYLDRMLETESTGSVAALITESYQGGAGSIIPPGNYMQRLKKWCEDRDIVFILDEVQSSFGRTGKMFAYEHWGIQPNLLCLGKGIGSGVPISALVGESRILDPLEPGSMSSTNGGNPLSSRAALTSIQIIEEEKLADRSARLGKMMLVRLDEMKAKYEMVGDVRGMGLAVGVEIVTDKASRKPDAEMTRRITQEAFNRGLIMIAPIGFYGNVIRIAPPLVIEEEHMMKGLDIMEEAIRKLS